MAYKGNNPISLQGSCWATWLRGLFLTAGSKLSRVSIHEGMKIEQPKRRRWFGFNQKKADSNRRNHFVLKQMAMCGCAIFNLLRDAQMYSEYPLAIKRGKAILMDIFNPQILHVLNIYLCLPLKWPSFIGKYSIHGAYPGDVGSTAGHSRQLGPGHRVSASCGTPNVPGAGRHGGGCHSLGWWGFLQGPWKTWDNMGYKSIADMDHGKLLVSRQWIRWVQGRPPSVIIISFLFDKGHKL